MYAVYHDMCSRLTFVVPATLSVCLLIDSVHRPVVVVSCCVFCVEPRVFGTVFNHSLWDLIDDWERLR